MVKLGPAAGPVYVPARAPAPRAISSRILCPRPSPRRRGRGTAISGCCHARGRIFHGHCNQLRKRLKPPPASPDGPLRHSAYRNGVIWEGARHRACARARGLRAVPGSLCESMGGSDCGAFLWRPFRRKPNTWPGIALDSAAHRFPRHSRLHRSRAGALFPHQVTESCGD